MYISRSLTAILTFERRGAFVVSDWQLFQCVCKNVCVASCALFTVAVGRFWLMTVVAVAGLGPGQPSGQNLFEHT